MRATTTLTRLLLSPTERPIESLHAVRPHSLCAATLDVQQRLTGLLIGEIVAPIRMPVRMANTTEEGRADAPTGEHGCGDGSHRQGLDDRRHARSPPRPRHTGARISSAE